MHQSSYYFFLQKKIPTVSQKHLTSIFYLVKLFNLHLIITHHSSPFRSCTFARFYMFTCFSYVGTAGIALYSSNKTFALVVTTFCIDPYENLKKILPPERSIVHYVDAWILNMPLYVKFMWIFHVQAAYWFLACRNICL